jgi:hypothetical protein
MRTKLGLQQQHHDDAALIRDWLALLQRESLDYSIAHRQLAEHSACPYQHPLSQVWWHQYQQRLIQEGLTTEQRATNMNAINPLYVLRTWMAQEAIDKATAGDDTGVVQLRQLLSNPFVAQCGMERYARESPAWAKGLSLSCSS